MLTLSQHAGELNFLDLELLHHYCNFTAQTFSDNPLLGDFWRLNVVKLGLETDYVMRSILSLAALHLAYLNPDRKDQLLEKSMLHHEISSRTAVSLMEHVRDENKAHLFIFSVLTIYIGGSPRSRFRCRKSMLTCFSTPSSSQFAISTRIAASQCRPISRLDSPLLRDPVSCGGTER